MKLSHQRLIKAALGLLLLLPTGTIAQAMQRGGRGGGGARPSMGNVGGGGGRPSMGGGGMSMPQVSRPNPSPNLGSRPSLGNIQLPASPATRPSMPSLPTTNNRPAGGFNPSGGGRPSVNMPSLPIGTNNPITRPTTKLPASPGPTTRPAFPNNIGSGNIGAGNIGAGNIGAGSGINRPTTLPGNANRPSLGGDRPSLGNINRPQTLPGKLPETRPGTLPGTLPGALPNSRPSTLPGNITRPGIGGERPNIGAGNRPNITNPNRPSDRPTTLPGTITRPTINANRPGNTINNNLIQIGNNNSITTRPAWQSPNWNRPDWGWGGGNNGWADDWHNNCVHHHHNWYNGCWNHGYWGSSWYVPVAWGAAGWGLGTWTSTWGYGSSYYNPYYIAPATSITVPYDYSQTVSINNYISSDTSAVSNEQPAQPVPQIQQPEPDAAGLALFDQGLASFKAGKYVESLSSFDQALKVLPTDPVVHEVRALNLFALGQYPAAAASLNSLLASAPGMDWTTMSTLYGDVNDYSTQLKKLEQFCESKPNDAASHFLLAYHQLVVGAQAEAIEALKVVVKNESKDSTARRMLDALVATQQPAASSTLTATADTAAPSTDLVGTWRATTGTTTIELAITEDSRFTWKASSPGQGSTELQGDLTSEDDSLVLVNEKQGSMSGTVQSLGADKWQFKLTGSPASDTGLHFDRVPK